MVYPTRVEWPDVAIAGNIATDGRKPAPPLETAYRLHGTGVIVVSVRSLLVIRLLQNERGPDRTVGIGAATLIAYVASPRIGAVQGHRISEARLVRANRLRVPLGAEINGLLSGHVLEAIQQCTLHTGLRTREIMGRGS